MVGRKYSEEERKFIYAYAYGHSYKEIMEEFNRRFEPEIGLNQIRAYLKNHKILTGHSGRFEKGHVPANKGMKGTCAPGCEKTWFKKGNTSVKHKPIGTESIRHNFNKGESYIYIKVAEPNKWRRKHILEWEKYYGPVPKGKVVIFLDGDTSNTDISNLQMIDRSIHARLNQNHLRQKDADLTRTGINVATIISKVGELKKK